MSPARNACRSCLSRNIHDSCLLWFWTGNVPSIRYKVPQWSSSTFVTSPTTPSGMSLSEPVQVTRSPTCQAALMRTRIGLRFSCQLVTSSSPMPKSMRPSVLSSAVSVSVNKSAIETIKAVPAVAAAPQDMATTRELMMPPTILTYETGSKKNWPKAFFGSVTHISHAPFFFLQQGQRWPFLALNFQDMIHQSLRSPKPVVVVTSLGGVKALLFTSSHCNTCTGGSTPLNLWISSN
mmetsp:Transcript_23935/g.75853  ORF Transcript_23935/g.75853 Transcript_23935/m.75853 type:complete len:236 (+) Transcript_23935:201-908(+)